MATYEEIVDAWFFLRIPKGVSYEAFEGEPGEADRKKTRDVFEKMRRAIPDTTRRFFSVERLPYTEQGLVLLDERLTPKVAQEWMDHSDPNDPNNFFKLTMSELAVYLGDTYIRTIGGEWKYSRMPNFFQSYVEVLDFEVFVFDMVMKKCSSDVGHESLAGKWNAIREIVERRAEDRGLRPN